MSVESAAYSEGVAGGQDFGTLNVFVSNDSDARGKKIGNKVC